MKHLVEIEINMQKQIYETPGINWVHDFPACPFFFNVFRRVKDSNKQIKLFGTVVYGSVC